MDRMGWIARLASTGLLPVLLALPGCGGSGGDVEPLEGMEPQVLREMATEAFSLWDPASVQLVDLDLLRGRGVDHERHDLDIRYTVRKVNEPTNSTHAAQAANAARSPVAAVAERAPKLR